MLTPELENALPAGFLRRVAAMTYDGMLLLSLWFLLALLGVALNGGEAVPAALMQAICFLSSYLFFLWFWGRGGQTLGMRAWRLTLTTDSGQPLTPLQTLVRLVVAAMGLAASGLGLLWMLWEPRQRTWQDIATGSRVVVFSG